MYLFSPSLAAALLDHPVGAFSTCAPRADHTTLSIIWDYFLMVTTQRIWSDTKSRWIEITDGSFYENLGIQTLLRRQVNHIIVGDATRDTTWQYDYLHNLQKRIKGYFGKDFEWCGEIPEKNEIVWYRRFWVTRPDGTPTVIHYMKPYAYNAVLFKKNPSLDAPARTRAQFALKKVTTFVDSPKGKEFPQTSTVFQWYELEEFEAYRHLGYLMGWAYLSNIDFSDKELRPSAACRAL